MEEMPPPSLHQWVSLGGDGAAGGVGGTAIVNSPANTEAVTITTAGVAPGLLVQSVGGGGGNGGSADSGTGGASVINVTVTVGGKGGAGAVGGTVKVGEDGNPFNANITTVGDYHRALPATSIGGGGGAAGSTKSASGPSAASVSVAVGGDGGSGADAGTVDLIASGDIKTSGFQSPGLNIASVGGGGGSGGSASSASAGGVASVSSSVGGQGSGGGKGNRAAATFSGTIETTNLYSPGVSITSIGGGGGAGGSSTSLSASMGVSVSVGIGGSGAGGGAGGQAVGNISGDITTGDAFSPGILIQSVGGGVPGSPFRSCQHQSSRKRLSSNWDWGLGRRRRRWRFGGTDLQRWIDLHRQKRTQRWDKTD